MDKTYKRHSFTKLWIATAMFIFCCFATSAFAQEAVPACEAEGTGRRIYGDTAEAAVP